MTQQLVPAVNNDQAQAFMQSLSPEQLRILMGAMSTPVTQNDALTTVVEALADRLSGNGITGEMAAHWARQLEQLLTDDVEPAVRDAVSGLINILHRSGNINSASAINIEGNLRKFLDERKNQPQATVMDVDTIDTTAKPVTEPYRPNSVGFQSNPQGSSGQIPSLNPNQPAPQSSDNNSMNQSQPPVSE